MHLAPAFWVHSDHIVVSLSCVMGQASEALNSLSHVLSCVNSIFLLLFATTK
jgi:hypothetical protein